MRLCSVEGCQGPVHSRELCGRHHWRWKRHGDALTLLPRPEPMERFLSKVDQTTDCWVWNGSRTPAGYGLFVVGGKQTLAHRWYYQEVVREIPPDMVTDHLCRRRECVRPSHLDVVSNRENVIRGMSPTAVIHRQGVCRRGHLMTEGNVYVPPKHPTQRQCRACKRDRRNDMRAAGRRVT